MEPSGKNSAIAATTSARKLWSTIYLAVGVIIGLGAFGHGSQGFLTIDPALRAAGVAVPVAEVIRIVWYFVSACMLALGILIVWAWFAATRGARHAFFVPQVIGVLYALFGIVAFAYQHNPFWTLFVVEAALLLLSTFKLKRQFK